MTAHIPWHPEGQSSDKPTPLHRRHPSAGNLAIPDKAADPAAEAESAAEQAPAPEMGQEEQSSDNIVQFPLRPPQE